MSLKLMSSFFVIFVALNFSKAQAWGERGHSIVTQVAARLLVSRVPNGQEELKPFIAHELMLSHVSNVPDIYWRGLAPEISKPIASSHFIDLEYFGISKSEEVSSFSVDAALKLLKDNCAKTLLKEKVDCSQAGKTSEIFEAAGSAPWRIEQFANRLKSSLAKVTGNASTQKGKPLSKDAERHILEALVNAGLLAHFVGDLAQPLHATNDYDGFSAGLGGLHGYFETEVVNALDLGLPLRVHEFAKNLSLKSVTGGTSIKGTSPLELAFRLSADSFSLLNELKELDQKYALVERSSEKGGLRIPAKRKPASQVASFFEALVVKRLAVAATVLSEIYYLMWRESHSPNLSAFQSYTYPLEPELVPINYY